MKKVICKRIFAMIMAVAIIFTSGLQLISNVSAEIVTSGVCGKNATWEFNVETGELIISGTGEVTAIRNSYLNENTKTVIVGEGITSIGVTAFYGYEMESVTLPESLKKIKRSAFYECENLKEIVIPKNVKRLGDDCFGDCFRLKKVTILGNVKAGSIFGGCLPDVLELGGKCTKINEMLAAEEDSLKELKLINGNKNYKLKDGLLLSKNGKTLLSHVGRIKKITIPKKVTKIADYAFFMTYANKVTFNKKLKEIGNFAFAYCNLKKIDISENVTRVGNGAFASNVNLSSVTFSKKIKSIGKEAFNNCNIKEIKLYNNPTIKTGAFDTGTKISYKDKANKKGSFSSADYIIDNETGLKFVELYINEIEGADGYEIKLTQPERNKKITIKATETKVLKKTNFKIKYTTSEAWGPQIKKKYIVYAKVRPYTIENGKKVYGKWSAKAKLDGAPYFDSYDLDEIK